MKFWKHSLFVYIFISFEFSLDNVLGSLITNESENHFNTINIILFYVEVFSCQILRFWFWFFFVVLTSEDACLEKVIIPCKNIIYCIIKFFFSIFFFIVTQNLGHHKFWWGCLWKAIFLTLLFYNLSCLCLGKLSIDIRSHYMVTINYVIGFPTDLFTFRWEM